MRLIKVFTVLCVFTFSTATFAVTTQERIDAVEARAAAKILKLQARFASDPAKLAILIGKTNAAKDILIARLEDLPSPN